MNALLLPFLLLGGTIIDLSMAVSTQGEQFRLPGGSGGGPFETVKDWITAFSSVFPEAHLEASDIGSGSSQKALWGDIDCVKKPIGGLCTNGTLSAHFPDDASTLWGIGVAIKSQDFIDHDERGLLQLPVLGGSVLVAYSKDVTGDLGEATSKQLNLSPAVVAGIFNNSILHWDHPSIQADNPNLTLPSVPITVIVRSDSSGMSQTFTTYLQYNNPATWSDEAVGKQPDWPLSNLTQATEQSACAEGASVPCNLLANGQTNVGINLMRRPFSIGFLELGHLSALSHFVAQAHVSSTSNPNEFIAASADSLQTTMDGLSDKLSAADNFALNQASQDTPPGGYPISRYLYWYVKTSSSQYKNCYEAWLLFTFLEWAYKDPRAAKLALSHGLVTPPESVLATARNALRRIQCVVAEDEAYGGFNVGQTISAASYTPIPYREEKSAYPRYATMISIIFCGVVAVFIYFEWKRQKARSGWTVKPEELVFSVPPEIIGSGSFGFVTTAHYRGTRVAVKRAFSVQGDGGSGSSTMNSVVHWDRQATFRKEIAFMSQLRHPNVVTIIGACEKRTTGLGLEALLVLEYMDQGSLYDLLRNDSVSLKGELMLSMLLDISRGIRFLHDTTPALVHGDLKASNILVDGKFRAKVSDFGFTKRIRTSRSKPSGTSLWMAPELLRGEPNSTASDVYSFGVIVYEMYSRKKPYEEQNESDVLKQVVDPTVNLRPTIPPTCPSEIAHIMDNCWEVDPGVRPKMEEIARVIQRLDVKSVEPVAEYYPCVTAVIAKISGFEAWSSEREPSQVFQLLEKLSLSFAVTAERLDLFPVDSEAGFFAAVSGFPAAKPDHAGAAVQFGYECKTRLENLCNSLESCFGPGTSSLSLWVGAHSGPVTAGALRGGKFQLFGDTMILASQLSRTADRSAIHISQFTARLLRDADKSMSVTPREPLIHIEGKGELDTFEACPRGLPSQIADKGTTDNDKISRLVVWNTEVLLKLLEGVNLQRGTDGTTLPTKSNKSQAHTYEDPIEEVTELMTVPKFSNGLTKLRAPPDLGPEVAEQLKLFVSTIAAKYQRNAFHNFEHASHVVMSASKILNRIIKSDNAGQQQYQQGSVEELAERNHLSTFGISSDSLLQFSVVFAAVIHDVLHEGVSNMQLVHENHNVAMKYKGRCVAEQNSLDVSWNIFMQEQFRDLRNCICPTQKELDRFRMILVNCVIATDISDKALNMARKQRWDRVFQCADQNDDEYIQTAGLKATIVIEYVIQASDVAHTMQHWNVYNCWNEKLFQERYLAWVNGREGKDPSVGWYEGEIWFFDNYIIPLARKLETCGVFGVSSDEYLQYALSNRKEWETNGRQLVADMVEKYRKYNERSYSI